MQFEKLPQSSPLNIALCKVFHRLQDISIISIGNFSKLLLNIRDKAHNFEQIERRLGHIHEICMEIGHLWDKLPTHR